MPALDQQVRDALTAMHSMLQADGYALEVVAASPETVALKIVALPGACADCLVPPPIMEIYVRDGLRAVPDNASTTMEVAGPVRSAVAATLAISRRAALSVRRRLSRPTNVTT